MRDPYPYPTLPDEIREVSARHPITVERLQKINAMADTPTTRRGSLRTTHPVTSSNRDDANMPEQVPDQPDTTALSRPRAHSNAQPVVIATVSFNVAMQQEITPFVSHIMSKLNLELDAFIQINITSDGMTVQIPNKHATALKEGLEALCNIYTAWSYYPHAGGSLDSVTIGLEDYRFTTTKAVKQVSGRLLARQIGKLIANFVDPDDFRFETLVHEQKRIDECRLAMAKGYQAWQTRLDPSKVLNNDQLYAELTAGTVTPITYTMQPPVGGLSKPSTAAGLMSSTALAEQAEDEMHDSMDIVVSGKTLKTNNAKSADLARRLNIVRAAEAKEAAAALKSAKKSNGKKKTVTFSSSDHEDMEGVAASKPTSKVTKSAFRKRPASDIEEDGSDNGDSAKKAPASRKKAKKAEDRVEKASSESNDRSSDSPSDLITVAPENAHRGGSGPKW
jgi:hypothetical protein